MLKKSKLISAAAYSIIGSESSDKEFPIEVCLQRPPLKSMLLDTPEKLEALMASLYVLLVCKLIRRILNGKIFIKQVVVVKGSLVDKILGAIHCEIIGEISQLDDLNHIKVNIYDAFGRQLDSKTLCGHLELLNASYLSFQ